MTSIVFGRCSRSFCACRLYEKPSLSLAKLCTCGHPKGDHLPSALDPASSARLPELPRPAEDRRPPIMLNWSTHWCARHLEPLRAEWPKGASLAMLALFNAAAARPEITNHAGGRIEALDAALREFSPLCCHLGDDVMTRITSDALAGRVSEPREGREP